MGSKPIDKLKSLVQKPAEHEGLTFENVLGDLRNSVPVDCEVRDALITNSKGETVFEQKGVIFPKGWSQMAVNIVASKYFHGKKDSPERENSLYQLVGRVVSKIVSWGAEYEYFKSPGIHEKTASYVFAAELRALLEGQYVAFNSPVWFNVGCERIEPENTAKNWHWDAESKKIINEVVGYTRPQCSACFINSVEDNMESILDLVKTEGMLFKWGSGTGTNLSALRSSAEQLSGGGIASGPVSFMRGYDAFAGVIKSGGTCLAPDQPVFTNTGIKTVRELAETGKDFITLSKDKSAGRLKAKTARAWKSGHKQVVSVVTDKGEFHLSFDHPALMSDGQYLRVKNLKEGMSISSFSTDICAGYVRVHLQNGKKEKETLHRMIANDVLGIDIDGVHIHHDDENKLNNDPGNFIPLSPTNYASHHNLKRVETGTHIFQTENFSHAGEENGMHADSDFWKDEQKSEAYRSMKSQELLNRGDAADIQKLAARQKMINTGYKLINAGYEIDTFAKHVAARLSFGMKIPSMRKLKNAFERFGTYPDYYQELRANNHKVEHIQILGDMDVYDIEVDCPSPDDKSPNSSHNFAILPIGSTGHAGKGIFVSNTRRAAKMVILNADHPDIEEFILCKGKEEAKAHALMSCGYDGTSGPESEAYLSIAFQNANNSVRVTDEFMDQASTSDQFPESYTSPRWELKAVKDGHTVQTVKAKDLLWKIAEQTWTCGDPGLQYDTTINKWHTVPNSGRINGSNPCVEYLHLDDSACNLASFNLLKFYKDGVFDVKLFRHAVRIMTVAMDIIVDGAGYPTERIAKNSHDYRPLGLGFANLGALLMSMGLAYDSEKGREVAALITSVLGGQAYLTSAEMAEKCKPLPAANDGLDPRKNGAFPGYEHNDAAFMNVIKMHRQASSELSVRCFAFFRKDDPLTELHEVSIDLWRDTQTEGHKHGFRNGQVTVLAPTGTIGFMMDCDTTGIEPMISLVTYKKMVGGGFQKLTYPVVENALRKLGYSEIEIEVILANIEKNGTVVDSGLFDEDYAIFDCALAPKDGRQISWLGHVRMMEVTQPFLSGAISKTVNMPEDSTVQDIFDAYVESWKRGLKAVAIYRDGSKKNQVMVTKKDEERTEPVYSGLVSQKALVSILEHLEPGPLMPEVEDLLSKLFVPDLAALLGSHAIKDIAAALWSHPEGCYASDLQGNLILPGRDGEIRGQVVKGLAPAASEAKPDLDSPPVATRHRLADTRKGLVHKFSIAGHEGYLHVGLYPNGEVGEIFITMAKEGSTLSGLMDAYATVVSIGLQHGVPLKTFIDKMSHSRFEPSGWSQDSRIGYAKSIMDYIFRWLKLEYLDKPVEPKLRGESFLKPLLDIQEEIKKGNYEIPGKENGGRAKGGYFMPPPDSDNGSIPGLATYRSVSVAELDEYLKSESFEKDKNSIVRINESESFLTVDTIQEKPIPDEAYANQEFAKPQHATDALASLIDFGDAPTCSECGAITVRNGACFKCMSCGGSSGCS